MTGTPSRNASDWEGNKLKAAEQARREVTQHHALALDWERQLAATEQAATQTTHANALKRCSHGVTSEVDRLSDGASSAAASTAHEDTENVPVVEVPSSTEISRFHRSGPECSAPALHEGANARTFNALALRWQAAGGHKPEFKYQMQWRVFEALEWQDVTGVLRHPSCRKRGLQPDTSYEFRVRARTGDASEWAKWSDASIPLRTKQLKEVPREHLGDEIAANEKELALVRAEAVKLRRLLAEKDQLLAEKEQLLAAKERENAALRGPALRGRLSEAPNLVGNEDTLATDAPASAVVESARPPIWQLVSEKIPQLLPVPENSFKAVRDLQDSLVVECYSDRIYGPAELLRWLHLPAPDLRAMSLRERTN
eukprot:CAMPEP_0119304184 /NCGR_PEP_ID=MMETSP1333-20130426/5478_1 /TAXON_ID=418940 /ORGANISM="Scyphosphaera apsteinii, Strain RCC1455" /LENGTH=369 /DNA_ID=CAMNT_0007307031 /DNA_START=91 /DNA_END=1200 /DNA_ORIENTATION=+